MESLMSAPRTIEQLVEKFHRGIEFYKSPDYNETQVRVEFVNPLFTALGWPVTDSRVVAHEARVLVDGKPKRPDYAFYIHGTARFFVEAKKPFVNLKDNPESAYQVRRYGWSARLPVSHLTDFEEFNLYDCRFRPDQKDPAHKSRLRYFHYEQYLDQWDEIEALLAYDAVREGSLEALVEETKVRGALPVDASFLQEIERWREMLAKDIALHQPDLTHRELNHAVQMTIDRIVFLRICEDRGIEPYANLKRFGTREGAYEELKRLFRHADSKYNSGLFHFTYEAGREGEPDGLSLNLHISDEPLHTIIQNLYYPNSPYEFSVIETQLLGQVYERFLGKVIELSPGGQVEVVEKPEVRKAGGVFYTPDYIVKYVVQQTLAPLVEGKTPAEVDGLKILDPACGSGSFLIGAYQYLMDWYLNYYRQNHLQAALKAGLLREVLFDDALPQYKLAVAEKRRILCNNLYGVDLDQQAVEVTKLSLLLKMLEGENAESAQPRLLSDRILPDLSSNIKWGNALIGPDFYDGKQLNLFEEEDFYRVRVFDWHDPVNGFGTIMQRGGFDAVIGNPPYVRIQVIQETAPLTVAYYKQQYRSAQKGNYDLYVTFVERALQLLNASGRMGYILPHKFFNAQYGMPLRNLLAEGKHLAGVIHFGDLQIFAGASTYTCVLMLTQAQQETFRFSKVENLKQWLEFNQAVEGYIEAEKVTSSEWNFVVGAKSSIYEKLLATPIKLADIAKPFVGLQTSADTVFLFEQFEKLSNGNYLAYSKALKSNVELEAGLFKPVIRSGYIGRYNARPTALVLFPYEFQEGKAQLITPEKMTREYPLIWEYLLENKKLLSAREHGKFAGRGWYQLYPKNLDFWEEPKLMLPYMITQLSAYLDMGNNYFVNVTTGGFGVKISPEYGKLEYFTGLLNSKLLDTFLKLISTNFRGGYFAANKQFLDQLPIRLIDFNCPSEKMLHDEMVKLVERMLDLHDQLPSVSGQARKVLEALIAATDRDINALVYQLYDLTPEEIAIVEG